jgi:pimeloyl-ACP methyl ester carboxylesterase
MTATAHQTVGSALSGDIELFYRRFGEPGATPVLILHGANYYDSRDWVDVARDLGSDRAVVTYDFRGYGLSSWSLSQDYSLDAHLRDITNLLDHLGWARAIFVGHSRGGSFALRFAHEHPERVAGLALIDFSPGQTPGRSRSRSERLRVGPWGVVYESLEQAHAATSRNPGELETEAGRARVESIFGPRDGGWVNVRRDPAFQNERPNDRPEWRSELQPLDLWDALDALVRHAPVLVVRASRSASYDESALRQLRTDFAPVQVVELESGHDVPGTAPVELVAAVRSFLP